MTGVERLSDVDPALYPVLGRFMLLEEREHLQAQAGDSARELFTDLISGDRQILDDLFLEDKVIAALESHLAKPQPDSKSQESTPLDRLAKYFRTRTGVWAEALAEDEVETQANLEALLGGEVNEVAAALVGMRVKIDGRSITIKETRAQTSDFNEKHRNRPIFGEDRSDIYFARVYTNYFPFIRAGKPEELACVGIMAATDEAGNELTKPSHISKALGIDKASVGTATLLGDTLIFEVEPTA